MSKNEQRIKEEKELLKAACRQEPRDIELITELLKVHKSKIQMLRKRGLLNEIDDKIEEFILNLKARNTY